MSVLIVLARGWPAMWQVRVLLYTVTFLVAYELIRRIRQMKLSVTPEVVHVVNFNSKFALDLESVRIDDENNPDVWPQDDFMSDRPTSADTDGSTVAANSGKARSLCLTDDSGIKVPVGVAPSYGTRLDEISEDLYIAIDRMRAVGSS